MSGEPLTTYEKTIQNLRTNTQRLVDERNINISKACASKGISRSAMHRAMSHTPVANLTLYTIAAIADICDVSVSDLLSDPESAEGVG